jgi:hypothetical protein
MKKGFFLVFLRGLWRQKRADAWYKNPPEIKFSAVL